MTCYGDNCRITIPLTPEEILAKYEVDVFDETIGALTYTPDATVIPALTAQAWARFRNRPIGDYDYEYWLEQLTDVVNNAWIWYSKTLAVLLDAEQVSIAAQKDVTAETTVRDKDATISEDRDATVVKAVDGSVTLANGKVTVQAESKTGSDVVETEEYPDVAADSTAYLSGRVTTTPGAENTVTSTNSGSDVQTIDNDETVTDSVLTVTDNAEDETVTVSRTNTIYSGLNAEATLKLMDAIKAGNERFINELEGLFLNRW